MKTIVESALYVTENDVDNSTTTIVESELYVTENDDE